MIDEQDIANRRLISQQIARTTSMTPADVVSSLGAVQAQDYYGALWAIGLRLKDAKRADVEKAILDKEIVRTWPMRHTLHFVSHKDVKWMLSLCPEQKVPDYQRRNGLDEAIVEQGERAILKAFEGRKYIPRKELHDALKRTGIPALGKNEVRSHIIRRAAREGMICFGPHVGKQPAFVLLNDWVGDKNSLRREEALAALAKRYFIGHGPATVNDFSWWAGLRMWDAKLGLEAAATQLHEEVIDEKSYFMSKNIKVKANPGAAYLLPAFDEYLIAYRDRSAILDPSHFNKVIGGSTFLFLPTIVFDGRIIGTWRSMTKNGVVEITLRPFGKLSKMQKESINTTAESYASFIGKAVVLL